MADENGVEVRAAPTVLKGVREAPNTVLAVGAGAVPVASSEAVRGAEMLLVALVDGAEAVGREVAEGAAPVGVTWAVPVKAKEGETTELADRVAVALCAAVLLLKLLGEA